jgi:hypothetical protein
MIFDKDDCQEWTVDTPNEYAEYNGVKLEIWKIGNDEDRNIRAG